MSINLKQIHVGTLIKQRADACEIGITRICGFFKCTEKEIDAMFQSESIDTYLLLKWSKLLGYDFFRIYSQHLILYSPPLAAENVNKGNMPDLPLFRKNIYTREIIDFIIELLESGEKSKNQIIQEYRIPKTTLYKWVSKYKK